MHDTITLFLVTLPNIHRFKKNVTERLNNHFTANSGRNLAVEKLWKSVKIWQKYGHEFVVSLFLAHIVCMYEYTGVQKWSSCWRVRYIHSLMTDCFTKRRNVGYSTSSHRWLGSRVVSVLDSGAEGPGFKSQSRRCRVTVLGKLFTPILFTKQRNW